MASRNGLDPNIRRPKGVGFGRALPGAFSFGNGCFLNGANGAYFDVPHMVGKNNFSQLTYELFVRNPTGNVAFTAMLYHKFASGAVWYISFRVIGGSLSAEVVGTTTVIGNVPTGLLHIVMSATSAGVFFYINGGVTYGGATYFRSLVSLGMNLNPSEVYTNLYYGGDPGDQGDHDNVGDVRLYNVALTEAQAYAMYNFGNGTNPCVTEFLNNWYQFEVFESLDFSMGQDGSNVQLGIRDMSGKFNHLLPHNMDTNPASPTYVLKPF